MATNQGCSEMKASSITRRRAFVQTLNMGIGSRLGLGLGLCIGAWPALAAAADGAIAGAAAVDIPMAALTPLQTRHLRDWMAVLIHAQLEQGPTPRWTHRDCAGLVRFVVAEALREHTTAWKQSMGLLGQRLPPDLNLSPAQTAALRNTWRRADGQRAAYVGALELVQENTRFINKNLSQAERGDLLFYDLGDEQHLMVWMGPYVAYHTGQVQTGDSGLRAVRVPDLMAWKDTRWRPATNNPNFLGLYRLALMGGAA
jgi:uncharacterized protein